MIYIDLHDQYICASSVFLNRDMNINVSPMRGNSDSEDPDIASESPTKKKAKENSKSKMKHTGNFLAAGRT